MSAIFQRYTASSQLPVNVEEAFAYHEREGCLSRLTPPWESLTVESSDNSLAAGSQVVLKTGLGPIPLRWHARHTEYDPPNRFVDVQESGPFAHWQHEHLFQAIRSDESRLTDQIEYRVPLGPLGRVFGGRLVRGKIESMFAYRHRVTRDDLTLKASLGQETLTIAVSGATGLVGSSLCSLLTLMGHRVMKISRGQRGDDDTIAAWGDPSESSKFEHVDAVVHLAGKSIASGRWSDSVKQEIRASRVEKTQQLAHTLAQLDRPPKTFICASATGIYGDRGDEILTEDSSVDDDFLAVVAADWEGACEEAREAGIRVAHSRFGIILSPKGGALQKMLTPAKLMGGALGSGKQYWSWMALDDCIGAIAHLLFKDDAEGAFNFVSPHPITNRDFAKTLGKVLRRPALFPAPAFALRLALGEMADDLLLSSCRVQPVKLIESGYQFRFESLEEFLRYTLGKAHLVSAQQA